MILWNHKLSVFAADDFPIVHVNVPSTYDASIDLPSINGFNSFGLGSVSGSGSVITSSISSLYNSSTLSGVGSLAISPAYFSSLVVPDSVLDNFSYDRMLVLINFSASDVSLSGSTYGYGVNSMSFVFYGQESSPVSPSFNSGVVLDVPFYRYGDGIIDPRFSVTYDFTEYVNRTVSDAFQPYTPSFHLKISSMDYYFYSSRSSVSIGDLQDQTDDLTHGFDSSSGDQAADQLGQELDNYLNAEDALYDQMQYDVPEIDLQSDAQGILLASNFLQSLYVSDAFISKVITYVLSFGLILFIVGWLKKRDSG